VATAAVAVAAAIGTSASADARTVLGSVPETDATAITPNALFYAFDGEFEAFGVFRRGGDGKARRLPQFDGLRSLRAPVRDADENQRVVELAASRELVAISVSRISVFYEGAGESSEPGQSAIAVARPGGPARRLVQCERHQLGPVAVHGSVVAYLGAGCRNWIGVRDTASGRARVLRPPAGGSFGDPVVAGRYVAAVETARDGAERIAVYDWTRGRRAYAVQGNSIFALDRDGTLAVLRGAGVAECAAGEVAWYSVREPRAHVLPGACDEDLFLANGRVLYSRLVPGGSGPEPTLEYVATDLSSGDTMLLLRGGIGRAWPVYFDGRSLGYAVPACDGGTAVGVDTVAGLRRRPPGAAGPCTVSLARVPRTVRLNARGEFVVVLTSRTGFDGSLSLFDPVAEQEVGLQGGNHRVGAPERGRRERSIMLAAAEWDRLKSAGRLDVELRILVFQPAGANTLRSVPLTLLPPG